MYEFTNAELWRMIIALFFGGILIGYLLTSSVTANLLHKTQLMNCELADEIDRLTLGNEILSNENHHLRGLVAMRYTEGELQDINRVEYENLQ